MVDFSSYKKRLFRYRGNSMWPLFQDGDLLVVKKVSVEELRPGDCVVYKKSGGNAFIAHRIITVRPKIVTRGDFKPANDKEPVPSSSIVGRVKGRIRYGHFTRISGGIKGIWLGRFYRYAGLLEPTREYRGGRIARFVRKVLGYFYPLWRPHLALVAFASADGYQTYLLIRNRFVGIYKKGNRAWIISWPCSLLINPKLLPSL